MNTENVNQIFKSYLDSMQAVPAPNLTLMSVLTLSELRIRAKQRLGKKITQAGLAQALERGESTIQQWEYGSNLNGIRPLELITMATLFGCRIEEVIAAIENTRALSKGGDTKN